ncbi:MAG: hypothetical protein QOE79_1289 [Sphingomonadales bacterium]|nr:hypothetical protein [Sphingomonadales bacterium]MEA3050046.1 hypothetical protein [Sphingomonadales bacterium]
MKFEPGGIIVRHAYFPIASDLPAFAAAEFSSVAATGRWATTPIRSEVNFENFTFGSQQLVVFHIDAAGAPVGFDPDNLVQFAEFSARGPKTPASRKSPNNCFLNPALGAWSGLDILALENWYVDEQGRPIARPLQLIR